MSKMYKVRIVATKTMWVTQEDIDADVREGMFSASPMELDESVAINFAKGTLIEELRNNPNRGSAEIISIYDTEKKELKNQTKISQMTQQDYEQKKRECWEELRNELLKDEVQWQPVSRKEIVNFVFDRAYALGKQEKDAEETVIHGWVARDKSGDLYMYHTKPLRNVVADRWRGESSDIDLYNNLLFPDLTWDSDPIEVELIIKRKKK